jgi:hypothetical protein
MHCVALAQLISSSVPEPAGRVALAHVSPPSVVSMAMAGALASTISRGFGPMAVQFVAVEQDTVRNGPVPPGTVVALQVAPPSWLTNNEAPTEMQSVVLGHATSPIPSVPAGTDATCQVDPPSPDRTTEPA